MTPPPLFLRYRLPAIQALPSRCSGQGPRPAGSPNPVPGGRCGSLSRSSGGAPSPPAPPVCVPPTPALSGTGTPLRRRGEYGHRAPPSPETRRGGCEKGLGVSLPQGPGGPRRVRRCGAGGAPLPCPPCVRPRRKWPGNGSRLLRLVVFETSFLIRSRHAPGASRCHRAGEAAEPGKGRALCPRNGTVSTAPTVLP